MAHQRVNQLLAIPRQRAAANNGVHQQHAGIRQVHGFGLAGSLALAPHTNALARDLAMLAKPLVGRHDRRIALLRQHNFNQVLHVFQMRNAAAVLIRRHMIFAARVRQLLNHQIRHLGGHGFANFHLIAAAHFLRGAGNGANNLVPAERHNHAITLAESVEFHGNSFIHDNPGSPFATTHKRKTERHKTGKSRTVSIHVFITTFAAPLPPLIHEKGQIVHMPQHVDVVNCQYNKTLWFIRAQLPC